MLDFIVVQMSKVNREKGYWAVILHKEDTLHDTYEKVIQFTY